MIAISKSLFLKQLKEQNIRYFWKMSRAEYKRKWRKIQTGEKEILEYNDLEESFNQLLIF